MLTIKKHYLALIAAGALILFAGTNTAFAEDDTFHLPKVLQGLKIEGLAYLDYSSGVKAQPGNKDASFNEFSLTRGYLTVYKDINPWLAARITTDITRKSDGDWETRIKYLYAQLKTPDLGFLTQMKVEAGQGHVPWHDFEEHINPYRCQGEMAIERAGVFNSADVGVSIHGNFGGKLDDAKARVGNTHYDGKFGTWHIGVYNGGGYHSGENNNNKVVEGRLTIRPVPAFVPGLQFSYLGVYGDGNVKVDAPKYVVNLGMISYQNPIVILTAQYFQTKGNSSGSWVDANGDALKTEGYSFFANVKLAMLTPKLAVFGRYDHFDGDKDGKIGGNDNASYNMYIGGVSYQLWKGTQLVVAYQNIDYKNDSGGQKKAPVLDNNLGDDHKVQAVLEVSF
jgi:hypothetical protein